MQDRLFEFTEVLSATGGLIENQEDRDFYK